MQTTSFPEMGNIVTVTYRLYGQPRSYTGIVVGIERNDSPSTYADGGIVLTGGFRVRHEKEGYWSVEMADSHSVEIQKN